MKEGETFKGLAARSKGETLQPIEFQPGELRADEVEVAVEYCGICHSDLSMLENEWGMTRYPIVPGHEIIGTVARLGASAKNLRVGQRVGIGWSSSSCLACRQCLSGDQNLCPKNRGTIVERHGGFANRVRAQWAWTIPLPEALDPAKAGPLFCGGITVFAPLLHANVKATDRVGVIGIGGLGHMALGFLNKWGCEVYAFTSSPSKHEEARRLGAHHVVNSKDPAAMQKIAGALDFVLVTVNVPLDWKAIVGTLAPRGRLHFVGAVLEPVPIEVMDLILGQRAISGSPTGSPVAITDMLDFCARHKIAPVTEQFPMTRANEALEHLRSGQARYRIVLKNDL
jgi:alcohol/geraniol dehydrogenase (NADP+)